MIVLYIKYNNRIISIENKGHFEEILGNHGFRGIPDFHDALARYHVYHWLINKKKQTCS